MKKYNQKITRITCSLTLAAVIALTSAGCAGGNPVVTEAPEAVSSFPAIEEATEIDATAVESIVEESAAAATTSPADLSSMSATGIASTSATAAVAEEDDPASRSAADTVLKESVLAEALIECTGWGQSAGSSLHSASAATKLLVWANEVDAAGASSSDLEAAVNAEVLRMSSDQKDNLRSNWSSVSYIAGTILEDFDDVSMLLEDAGCLEAAKESAANDKASENWKAAEKAIDKALK